jgi:ribosomal protein S18 acetylase RimI-like enzyme
LPPAPSPVYLSGMSTDAIEIRLARPDDAGPIADVHDQAWRYAYRGVIPGPDLERMVQRRGPRWWKNAIDRKTRIVVLSFGGVIAGYATYGRNRAATLPYQGEIFEIYIRPEYQGIGLGRRLFKAVRRDLAGHEVKSLLVWALADNENACGFYKRLGGKPVDTTVERFGATSLQKIAFGWPTA